MNNGNPWQDLRYGNREDFDWSWVFIYASYSYDENAARYFAFFSTSESVGTTAWTNNNKRWPVQNMKFRVGPSHTTEPAAVSTRYRNIKFFWG
jgi:hypothetical protein